MDSDSTHSIEVTVEAPVWRSVVTDPEALCRHAASAVLDQARTDRPRPAELGIVLTDDGGVRDLNRTWRRKDAPTNVLSFPAGTPPGSLPEGVRWPLGDIVLAFETIAREAEEQRKPIAHHVTHLVVHGVLHLLGHDHEDDAEAERMERLEIELLAGLGVADPYAEAVS